MRYKVEVEKQIPACFIYAFVAKIINYLFINIPIESIFDPTIGKVTIRQFIN